MNSYSRFVDHTSVSACVLGLIISALPGAKTIRKGVEKCLRCIPCPRKHDNTPKNPVVHRAGHGSVALRGQNTLHIPLGYVTSGGYQTCYQFTALHILFLVVVNIPPEGALRSSGRFQFG